MADPVSFAPYKTPVIDPRTSGLISREWFLFFQALWNRTGGGSAPSSDDLLVNLSTGIGIGEVDADVDRTQQDLGQVPEYVTALRAEVAELQKRLQALEQGPIL